jgi:RND superfamily putative drug exporter
MMFPWLGQLVRRAWPLLLAAWAVLLAGTWLAAPRWKEVAQDKDFAFLPADVPSRRAEVIFAQAFPEDQLASNIVVVLRRSETAKRPLPDDLKFIQDQLEPGLRKIADADGGLASQPTVTDEPLFGDEPAPPPKPAKRSIMARIRTPNAPGTGALLISADRQVLLVVVELTTEFLSKDNWPTITKVKHLIQELEQGGKVPPGLELVLTGSAVIGRDNSLAQLQSSRAIGILTVVLVVGLLIVIYRAPLLALIPLATVFLAVQIAIDLLSILAGAGYLTVFLGLEIYITILSYGAGVDYCLFLTARYKEQLDRGDQPAEAVAHAVGQVGHTLVASAATVMCGIAMMMFAQFGKFSEAGFAIPLSLALVLGATLSFSPALLLLAGRWAFWPHRSAEAQPAGGAASAPTGRLQRAWDDIGHLLVRRPVTVWGVTALAMAPFAVVAGLLHDHLSYDLIGDLPAASESVAGTRTLQEHFPAGILGPTTVLLVNPSVNFTSPEGKALVAGVTEALRRQQQPLELGDVRSLTAPLGVTPAAAAAFAQSDVPAETRQEAIERVALDHYATSFGQRTWTGTRLDLILTQSPFSHQSIDDLDRVEEAIRAALPPDKRQDTQMYVVGTTASVRDLARVMQSDRIRIEVLVLISVFVVLVVLLRGLVVPVYLLLSVLFSYFTTLGVAFAVFWALDPQGFAGIDWKVAIFLFTILIAVGEDYNIFLLTRVHEEQRQEGPVRGITTALSRTGPIISSCGIIMAGTFAALLGSSLTAMKQLGFALAFGVLLDTFVVRPILVPAFLIWLAGGKGKVTAENAQQAPAPSDAGS